MSLNAPGGWWVGRAGRGGAGQAKGGVMRKAGMAGRNRFDGGLLETSLDR